MGTPENSLTRTLGLLERFLQDTDKVSRQPQLVALAERFVEELSVSIGSTSTVEPGRAAIGAASLPVTSPEVLPAFALLKAHPSKTVTLNLISVSKTAQLKPKQKKGKGKGKPNKQHLSGYLGHLQEMVYYRARGVPIRSPTWFDRTQVFTFRLYSDFVNINTVVTTGLIDDVVTIQVVDLISWTQVATLFQEYRPIGGAIHFISSVAVAQPATLASNALGTSYIGVGVVDYADATALTTTAEALQFDTAQVVHFLSAPKIYTWPIILEPIPDQAWGDTAVSTFDLAVLKFYADTAETTAINVGRTWFYLDVQMRGLQ